MFFVSVVWLAVRSIQKRNDSLPPTYSPMSKKESRTLAIIALAPFVIAFFFYSVPSNAPFRKAYEADALFEELCKDAGETVFKTAQNVESVYVSRSVMNGEISQFTGVKDGHYDHLNSYIGLPLDIHGYIKFFESDAFQPFVVERDGATWRKTPLNIKEVPYIKYDDDYEHGIGVPQKTLNSEYGLFQESLVDRSVSSKLGVFGYRVTIKNLRTDETLGVLKLAGDRGQRKVCGQTGDGDFGIDTFLFKVLSLKKHTYKTPPPRK